MRLRCPVLAALAVQLAASGLLAQSLEIRPAVELVIQLPRQSAFTLSKSSDLQSWTPLLRQQLSEGNPTRRLVAASDPGPAGFFQIETNLVRDLNSLLEPIRAANQVPGLACAVVLSNQIVGVGAVGIRKAGFPSAPVTAADRWHLGSLTKSMTATLAGLLVEEGRVRWETTLAEAFPNWSPKMHPDWRGATLEQLTSNRAGAPEDLNALGLWSVLWDFGGPPREARHLLLERLTVLPPRSKPGTRYEYSNAGFALAGHLLETLLDRPWEDLLADRLFTPLGMTSAGFGVPATPRYLDQPWGHQLRNGQAVPIEPGPAADNPSAIGPAGTVHASILDLARYAAFHVHGHNRDPHLLRQPTLLKLHTAYPENAQYAHGWMELDRPWAAPGKAYHHAGSNTQWYAIIWFAPAREFAVVVTSNIASTSQPNPGALATDQTAARMIQEFLQR